MSTLADSKMKTGGLLALIGGILGTLVNLWIFVSVFPGLGERYAAKGLNDELQIMPKIFPYMNDIGTIAGIVFFVAAWGFFAKKDWAWNVAMVAATGGLMGGWMCFLFPLMAGEPPLFLSIFIPDLIIWLLLVLHVRPTQRKFWVLGLLAGMAFVLNFMNGIEVVKMLVTKNHPLLLVVQKLNWVAAVGFGLSSLGLVFYRKWSLPIGIGAGILAIMAGFPLAFLADKIDPLFLFGPIAALLLLIYFLLYGNKIWAEEKAPVVEKKSSAV